MKQYIVKLYLSDGKIRTVPLMVPEFKTLFYFLADNMFIGDDVLKIEICFPEKIK